MTKLATESEIQKTLCFLNSSWQVQNDKQDQDTGFIYHCQRLDQVIDLATSNEVDMGYAIHRWYNFECSKTIENIFCEFGAVPYHDEKDHDIDLTIEGIPFDIKVSIISNKYNGDLDLTKRANKDKYMQWLLDNASQEGRKHTQNKIFVICDKLSDKCLFNEIRYKIECFMAYFKDNIDKYKDKIVNELIYVKGE